MSANVRPQHCWGEEWGDDEMNPKPNKKLSLGAVLGPFPVILLKLATLRSPPTPNKVEFCAKWVEMSAFYTKTWLRGVGDDEMNPKLNKRLSLGAVLGSFQGTLLKNVPVRSPPTTNKVEFCTKWVEMSAFFTTTLLRGVGGRRDEPKAEQKMIIRSRLLRNNYLEGLFHTALSSSVLHCSFPHLRSITTSICIRTKIPMRRSRHMGKLEKGVNTSKRVRQHGS